MLSTLGLTMDYPGIRALDSVTVEFAPGKVHAVIGENGAGKSTLMKILAGIQTPTSGQIFVEGTPVMFRRVQDALAHGVAMVHQELNLVGTLTIAENIFLGREFQRLGILDRSDMSTRARELLKMVGSDSNPDDLVEGLSVAEQQLVEIAKAVSYEAQVILFDEPTAVLSPRESEKLFDLIRELAAKGTTILYISHRLVEVIEIAETVTVLRDGKVVEIFPDGCKDTGLLASAMVGRDLTEFFPQKSVPESTVALGVTVFGSSLEVKKGEVVGLAGLVGSGRTELAEAIVGLRPHLSLELSLFGSPVEIKSVRQAKDLGIDYVSEDRKSSGLVLSMSCRENLTLPSLAESASLGVVRLGAESAIADGLKTKLDIRASSLEVEAGSLSGGNQQKIAIGKWLACEPRVLILDEPTRGVDVGAKGEIYRLIHELASSGMACLVISSELPELLGLCHRIAVLHDHHLAGVVEGSEMSEEAIIRLASGLTSESRAF